MNDSPPETGFEILALVIMVIWGRYLSAWEKSGHTNTRRSPKIGLVSEMLGIEDVVKKPNTGQLVRLNKAMIILHWAYAGCWWTSIMLNVVLSWLWAATSEQLHVCVDAIQDSILNGVTHTCNHWAYICWFTSLEPKLAGRRSLLW